MTSFAQAFVLKVILTLVPAKTLSHDADVLTRRKKPQKMKELLEADAATEP